MHLANKNLTYSIYVNVEASKLLTACGVSYR